MECRKSRRSKRFPNSDLNARCKELLIVKMFKCCGVFSGAPLFLTGLDNFVECVGKLMRIVAKETSFERIPSDVGDRGRREEFFSYDVAFK